MILKIYNDKKELENTIDNQNIIKNKLLELLYNKYINKSNYIKNIQYTFNYTDIQQVTFILSNNYRIVISYIPTTQGTLEAWKL